MRDEIDGRIWAENHETFSASVSAGLSALAGGARRLTLSRAISKQLLAGIAAFGMTLLTLSASVA